MFFYEIEFIFLISLQESVHVYRNVTESYVLLLRPGTPLAALSFNNFLVGS